MLINLHFYNLIQPDIFPHISMFWNYPYKFIQDITSWKNHVRLKDNMPAESSQLKVGTFFTLTFTGSFKFIVIKILVNRINL